MAEFAQTMKDWRRMCKTYSTEDDDCCKGCPILALEYDEHGCDAIFSDWAKSADWDEVESVIVEWAAEHPEPVYPTWSEVLKFLGVLPEDQTIFHMGLQKPIPADIAEKLGIEPKEGE